MDRHQQRQEQASVYAAKKRAYGIVEFVLVAVCFIAAFLFSSTVASLFSTLISFAAAALYFLIFAAVYFIILFPVQYLKNYLLPKDFGLLKQSFGAWLGAYIKTPLLVLLLGAAAFGLLYMLIVATPDWWWLWTALLVAVVSFLFSAVFPVFILPLMYKSHSMPDGRLRDELQELIKRSQVSVPGIDILEISEDEDTANAMMMGIGKTRRITFSDTLLNSYTQDEIKVICAHELGHVKKAHFTQTLFVSLLIIMLVFFLTNLTAAAVINLFNVGDITTLSAMPITILLFFVLYSVFMIFSNIYSRSLEKEADLYALQLTKDPLSFISMLQKITDQNLDEENPHPLIAKLLYDHPSGADRKAMAERFIEEQTQSY